MIMANNTPATPSFAVWALKQHFGQPFTSLPTEVMERICKMVGIALASTLAPSTLHGSDHVPVGTLPSPTGPFKDPEDPPANRSCPLLRRVPHEIRRLIFAHELKPILDAYVPHCCNDSHQCEKKHIHRDVKSATTDKKGSQQAKNRALDFMVLCKVLKDEISTILYEERYFVVHVHEGIRNVGIEFLNSGRQQLQFQDEVLDDSRFARFCHGEEYGFDRIKKIKFLIFPPSTQDMQTRHPHVNTFYMLWSACQLLQHGCDKNRLAFLTIEFAPMRKPSSEESATLAPATNTERTGCRAIAKSETYLWDMMTGCPSTTTIHNHSDIEMILRPFSILRAHNVTINLPPRLDTHAPTIDFVASLKQRILSLGSSNSEFDNTLLSEYFAHQIRGLQVDMQRYANELMYSTSEAGRSLADLTMRDWDEDGNTSDRMNIDSGADETEEEEEEDFWLS
ncbi:hypothetical protein LTR62_007105 [Meristemomyces frigidus]|uniref:Uncharacterized protein n=1 Tax=Meristemomyces frigidus TaxID=1508187 RepID=A0AAN7TB07_9PEZI|nr:hypothetical protein LTR62_007105 [Meristemomyces frigidus]